HSRRSAGAAWLRYANPGAYRTDASNNRTPAKTSRWVRVQGRVHPRVRISFAPRDDPATAWNSGAWRDGERCVFAVAPSRPTTRRILQNRRSRCLLDVLVALRLHERRA